MCIAFVLPGFYVSGGVHIVLRWAEILARAGHDVSLYVPDGERRSPIPAMFLPDGVPFAVRGLSEAGRAELDLVFATWWETLKLLYLFRARRYAFFVQALEGQFYEPGDQRQEEYMRLLRSGVSVVTIAHWLARYLVRYYGVEPDRVQTVLNPLDHALWRPVAPAVPRGHRVRFLVEGSTSEARKNVAAILGLLEELGAEYIWVGATVDRRAAGPRCVRVFERVPYRDMPAVYSSCDVLVKLSTAEGMFGPPLEMFATGGTAIAWDVWGAEEYMAHGHNCLLLPMHSLPSVREAIGRLQADRPLLGRLREGARRTAARWIDWDEQRPAILRAVEDLPPNQPAELFRQALVAQAEVLAALWEGDRDLGAPLDLRGLSLKRLLLRRMREAAARTWAARLRAWPRRQGPAR